MKGMRELILIILFFNVMGCGYILPNKNFSFKIDTSLNLDRKNLSFDFDSDFITTCADEDPLIDK
jgi:hypothetical protein